MSEKLDRVLDGIDRIYSSQSLRGPEEKRMAALPPLIRQARELEKSGKYGKEEDLFFRQGMLLANYEDDFEFSEPVISFYPSYAKLSDRELRGYFAWRTKIRRGEFPEAPLSFIYLYVYELLNNIGVATPADGLRKLHDVYTHYASSTFGLNDYLDEWLIDYLVYYDLKVPALPPGSEFACEECARVFEDIDVEPQEKVADALKGLDLKWLRRSKFYAANSEDMELVLCRVLKKMAAHYNKSCRYNLAEQYFGTMSAFRIYPFNYALFCDPLKRRNYSFELGQVRTYSCKKGMWWLTCRPNAWRGARKMEKLAKTVDCIMRQVYSFGHPVKPELSVKWVQKLIREEAIALLEQKKAARKNRFRVDLASLDQVRADASEIRDRLIVDDMQDNPAMPEPAKPADPAGLTDAELRLLHALLYGGDLDWIAAEGHMLSVLVDSINEKLYDTFGDAVVDDTPQVMDDYLAELKEMITA